MKKNIAVSVVVPVFNRLRFCGDALRILKAQTLKNIEFIIVDDGSTDGSYEYLLKKTKSDKRFKIYKLEKNSGPSVARNFALNVATGEYVGFFDIDDGIPADYFEKLYKTACDKNTDIVFAIYNNLLHRSTGTFSHLVDKIACLRNGSACDKLFKRDLIVKHNIRFLEGKYCADNVFVFFAFLLCKNIFVCNEPVYQYALSADSISCDDEKSEKRKSDILCVVKTILDFAEKSKIDDLARTELYHFLCRTFNRYQSDDAFNAELGKMLSSVKPIIQTNNFNNMPKRNRKMFWLKLKKKLGLIRTKSFEKILLFNKIRCSGLFDEEYYLRKYPDVKQAGVCPIEHYLTCGWTEGRNPSTRFDTNAYLSDNPDVACAQICPLLHYIEFGMDEGRYVRCLPVDKRNSAIDKDEYNILKKSKLFNEKWYLKTYSDVKDAKFDPIEHYIRYGADEGRNPSKYFDTKYYLNRYIDVKKSGMNPLFHYITYGIKEGRVSQTAVGKVLTPRRTIKQKIRYAWEYPVRVHDEYLRLKEEIKKLKNSK